MTGNAVFHTQELYGLVSCAIPHLVNLLKDTFAKTRISAAGNYPNTWLQLHRIYTGKPTFCFSSLPIMSTFLRIEVRSFFTLVIRFSRSGQSLSSFWSAGQSHAEKQCNLIVRQINTIIKRIDSSNGCLKIYA